MVRHEPEPVDDPGDFGFYEPDAIMEWAPDYYLSGHHPGHLPRPGGKLAQTKAVRHDLRLYLTGIAWAQWEKLREDEAAKKADDLLSDTDRAFKETDQRGGR